jgi:hypothetical protein
VLAALLNGSRFDYVMTGSLSNPAGVEHIILIPRSDGSESTSPMGNPAIAVNLAGQQPSQQNVTEIGLAQQQPSQQDVTKAETTSDGAGDAGVDDSEQPTRVVTSEAMEPSEGAGEQQPQPSGQQRSGWQMPHAFPQQLGTSPQQPGNSPTTPQGFPSPQLPPNWASPSAVINHSRWLAEARILARGSNSALTFDFPIRVSARLWKSLFLRRSRHQSKQRQETLTVGSAKNSISTKMALPVSVHVVWSQFEMGNRGDVRMVAGLRSAPSSDEPPGRAAHWSALGRSRAPWGAGTTASTHLADLCGSEADHSPPSAAGRTYTPDNMSMDANTSSPPSTS